MTKTEAERPSPTSEPHRAGRRKRAATIVVAISVAVLVAPTLVTARARAASPEPSDQAKAAAKAKLVEGAALLRGGEYQAALERFRAAYDLVPSPKIQFNFGLAYRGLGRNAEAVEAFGRFLTEVPGAGADTIAKARQYRAELDAQVGRLMVVTGDLEGASIVVDGRAYGTTPRKDEILLDPGPHLLLVEQAGRGGPFTQRLDVAAGQRLTVEARLAPAATPVVSTPAPVVPAPLPPVAAVEAGAQPPAPASQPPALLVTQAPPPSRGGASPSWPRPAAYGAGAAALVALGFGAVEWIRKEQKYGKFNDDGCDKALPESGGGACGTLLSEGESAKRLGTVGFVAGGVLGAASVALLVWQGTRHPERAAVSLTCRPGLALLGGACAWRF